MDKELKYRLRMANKAIRGGVYDFVNATGDYKGICIVVGGDHRSNDKYVSAISLSPCDADTGLHNDEMGLRLPDGREFWVHCGMITYIRRDRLGDMIYKVSDATMKRIGVGIKHELGLDDGMDYEKLYRDLINTIANWNKEER